MRRKYGKLLETRPARLSATTTQAGGFRVPHEARMPDTTDVPTSASHLSGPHAHELFKHIEDQIAAIDPTPWRAVFDDDELVIWFHANLTDDPRRIVIAGNAPSDNEYAAAAFLTLCREHCTVLIGEVRRLNAELAKARGGV